MTRVNVVIPSLLLYLVIFVVDISSTLFVYDVAAIFTDGVLNVNHAKGVYKISER